MLWVNSRALVHLRVGLFLDGRNDDAQTMRPGSIQQKKREAPIAGDETERIQIIHGNQAPGAAALLLDDAALTFLHEVAQVLNVLIACAGGEHLVDCLERLRRIQLATDQ